MTTITIKDGKNITKTEFQTIQDFLDWAIEHFQNEPPLSKEIIQKAEKAKAELHSNNSTFKPAI